MWIHSARLGILALDCGVGLGCRSPNRSASSWNDEATKNRLSRSDDTRWIEQPIFVQFAFTFDRVKALAPLIQLEGQAALQARSRIDTAAVGAHGAAEIVA